MNLNQKLLVGFYQAFPDVADDALAGSHKLAAIRARRALIYVAYFDYSMTHTQMSRQFGFDRSNIRRMMNEARKQMQTAGAFVDDLWKLRSVLGDCKAEKSTRHTTNIPTVFESKADIVRAAHTRIDKRAKDMTGVEIDCGGISYLVRFEQICVAGSRSWKFMDMERVW